MYFQTFKGFDDKGKDTIRHFNWNVSKKYYGLLTTSEQSTLDSLNSMKAAGLTLTAAQSALYTELTQKKSAADTSTQKGLTQEQSDALLAGLSSLFSAGASIYTGTAEQRALKKKIQAACGKRPHGVFSIKSKKKKAEIAKWEKCAKAYTDAQPAIDVSGYSGGGGGDDDDDDKKPAIGTFGWVAISVVGVAALAGIGVLIYKMTNKKNAAAATVKA